MEVIFFQIVKIKIRKRNIDLFCGTLSLAEALETTGAGEMIAAFVIGALGSNPSPLLFTFVVFILCCVMTNFMSNTATTALMAPICLSIAQGMGGKYSVMGVNIENTARHPSAIGVAVNVGCWSHRRGHIIFDRDLNYTITTHTGFAYQEPADGQK